jgi:transposase
MPPHLTQKEKIDILIQHSQGQSMRSIAQHMRCSLATVSKTVKKYHTTGSIDNAKRTNPRIFTSPTNRRKLRDLVRRHRQWTSKHLAGVLKSRYKVDASARTVRRERNRMRFRQVGYSTKPMLTLKTRLKRVKYCNDNEGEDWDDIWFSDEKLFKIDFTGKKVWKQPWEDPVVAIQPPRSVSLFVWGAVNWNGRTSLHTTTQPFDANAYMNIIYKHLIQQQPESFDRLLQDNAGQHKAHLTLDFLNNFDVELVHNYPPWSPELNPIEHMWGWMVKYIQQDFPSNLATLKARVREAWDAIPQETIRGYISHLPTVCKQIIAAKGGNILK